MTVLNRQLEAEMKDIDEAIEYFYKYYHNDNIEKKHRYRKQLTLLEKEGDVNETSTVYFDVGQLLSSKSAKY